MAGNEIDGPITSPVLGAPPAERPSRLGRGGRFVVYLLIGAFVAVAAAGWGYVMLAARGNPEAAAQVISFDAGNPAFVTVTFEVYKPADRAAACRMRATDAHHVEVGSREVGIPAGKADVTRTERLETSAQATSGYIQYCYLVQ
jgi:hypothetical protein